MIELHRLKGGAFLLNPDLIETVESTPDTVVTLVDGKKIICTETPDEVRRTVTLFRAELFYLVARMDSHDADLAVDATGGPSS